MPDKGQTSIVHFMKPTPKTDSRTAETVPASSDYSNETFLEWQTRLVNRIKEKPLLKKLRTVVIKNKDGNIEKRRERIKFLSFHSDDRPAYYGTWTPKKRRKAITKPVCPMPLEEDIPLGLSWDPATEGGLPESAYEETNKDGEDSADVGPFISVEGLGRFSTRNPFGINSSLVNYAVDSEGE